MQTIEMYAKLLTLTHSFVLVKCYLWGLWGIFNIYLTNDAIWAKRANTRNADNTTFTLLHNKLLVPMNV